MIHDSDLIALLSQWKKRLQTHNSPDYNCALGECIYDLQNLLDNTFDYQDYLQEKMSHIPMDELEEYFMEQEADSQISQMKESIA